MRARREHRIALRGACLLMRAALGARLAASEHDELRRVDPARLVRVATAHAVANLIAGAFARDDIARLFDPDLRVFFAHLCERNRIRNERLKGQLVEAADILGGAGIEVVALKGGAELVAPLYPASADRFLSDLDLLVPSARLDDAVAALEASGYRGDGAFHIPSHRHAPPLWRPGGVTGVEVHSSPCDDPRSRILCADDMLARAAATTHRGLATPCLADRLCHLVTHAQFESGHFDSHWLLLRDAADLAVLRAAVSVDVVASVRERFVADGRAEAFDAFFAAASLVMGEALVPDGRDEQSRRWARQTLDFLADTSRARRRLVASTLRAYGHRLASGPAERARVLAALRSPARVGSFVRRYVEVWRGLR